MHIIAKYAEGKGQFRLPHSEIPCCTRVSALQLDSSAMLQQFAGRMSSLRRFRQIAAGRKVTPGAAKVR
jgi:hypothetical protein